MMHGPCGTLNSRNVCMQNGSCKNYYLCPFNAETQQGKDSYPIYHRRDNGQTAHVRGETLDNRWVVPYNPYLLRRYNCHINVEICSSIKAVKYLFKYIYKGHDQASIAIDEVGNNGNVDEIKQYRDSRWVTPPEALWRIYGFDLSETFPSVKQLQLHLPNMHTVSYLAEANLNDAVSNEGANRTMLTHFLRQTRNLSGHKESFIEISLHTLYGFRVGSIGKRGMNTHKLEESCLLIRPKGRGTISEFF
jgi:hypothetical protein